MIPAIELCERGLRVGQVEMTLGEAMERASLLVAETYRRWNLRTVPPIAHGLGCGVLSLAEAFTLAGLLFSYACECASLEQADLADDTDWIDEPVIRSAR